MTKLFEQKKHVLSDNCYMSINHCNLPAKILGGLTYNSHPIPLALDGVKELHKSLFHYLDKAKSFAERQPLFFKYMNAHFQLNDLSQMGQCDSSNFNRKKINYKRIIFGWHMNPDGLEGAVLKRWVESRFGLSPRYHKGLIREIEDHTYHDYLMESAAGMYNTNAIETQLDILYSYSQFELANIKTQHITLYRGLNQLNSHEVLAKSGKNITILLNNINSFTHIAEMAEHFGDYVIRIDVPIYKIFCYNNILPKQINAEEEYIVIGGLYSANLV